MMSVFIRCGELLAAVYEASNSGRSMRTVKNRHSANNARAVLFAKGGNFLIPGRVSSLASAYIQLLSWYTNQKLDKLPASFAPFPPSGSFHCLKVGKVHMIDLRSDTVTRPSHAMRQAMAWAEVGDDMMGEDPTVNKLEKMVAEMFGHQSAIFACSGTQSNQMGVRVHCIPGDELLINETGHIALFEAGAPAALSGVTVRTIAAPAGFLDVPDLEDKIRANDQHYPRTRLLCLENTTNIGGGRVYPMEQLQRVSAWAVAHGLKRHLDGARLFNAVTAGGYSAEALGKCFDTISICFSKGLGCPMGSMLVGGQEDIARARRIRKLFGGSLRQAGIVASAAVFALENNVARLQEDHVNAQQLAKGLAAIDGIHCEAALVESNLVFFEIEARFGTAVQLTAALKEQGVLILPMGGQRVRAVTHLDVNSEDIVRTLAVIQSCLSDGLSNKPAIGSGPYSK